MLILTKTSSKITLPALSNQTSVPPKQALMPVMQNRLSANHGRIKRRYRLDPLHTGHICDGVILPAERTDLYLSPSPESGVQRFSNPADCNGSHDFALWNPGHVRVGFQSFFIHPGRVGSNEGKMFPRGNSPCHGRTTPVPFHMTLSSLNCPPRRLTGNHRRLVRSCADPGSFAYKQINRMMNVLRWFIAQTDPVTRPVSPIPDFVPVRFCPDNRQ